ncbi:MAG TPA: exodeoxyribonuclease VII large subunit [Candidatus Macondimonas sp.]|nr:exodeoxyribonuclease VII large subunit [Candidatus Macondimonas sp.]
MPVVDPENIYSVSRLNREARLILEERLPPMWVMGEISNFVQATSGHWYFSLKDAQAQVRCAMFRNRTTAVPVRPQNGLQVQIRAQVSLYEPRGEFQLIADQMQPAGAGALRLAFEALKARLAEEGLFDPAHRRPLPAYPRTIGVVSSPTGAALRDILHVLARRYPLAPVILYPVAVQGADAEPQIVRALALAGARRECDVIILARGGGPLEDLWAFNLETVARAVRACPIPVVSGVGHEIDFTIADFVADLRAPTPSAAAESVVPDRIALAHRIDQLQARLSHLALGRLQTHRLHTAQLTHRLEQCHPERRLQRQRQLLDELETRMARALHFRLERLSHRLAARSSRLWAGRPQVRLQHAQDRLARTSAGLHRTMNAHLAACGRRLAGASRALDAVSPLGTLERGYAIVRRWPDGAVVQSPDQAPANTRLQLHLHRGSLICRVESTADTELLPW